MYTKNDVDRVLRKAVIVNIIGLTALLTYQVCEIAVKALFLFTCLITICCLISVALRSVIKVETGEKSIKELDDDVYSTAIASFMSLLILMVCDQISIMTGVDIVVAFFFVASGAMLTIFIINKIVLRVRRSKNQE